MRGDGLLGVFALACVSALAAEQPTLDVYTHPKCKYCIDLKAFIKERGLEYNDHPLGDDGRTGWAEMQKRAMGCCEASVHEHGPPEKVLTIMPHLFINDVWFGPRQGHQLDFELLAKELDKYLPYSLDDPKADHVSKAIAFDEAGDIANAIASFRAATKHKPKRSEHWFNLGVALRDEANPQAEEEDTLKEAAHCFAHALKLNPKNKEAKAELESGDLKKWLEETDEL